MVRYDHDTSAGSIANYRNIADCQAYSSSLRNPRIIRITGDNCILADVR